MFIRGPVRGYRIERKFVLKRADHQPGFGKPLDVVAMVPVKMGEDDRVDVVSTNAHLSELFVYSLTRFLPSRMVVGHRPLRIAHASVNQNLASAALYQKGENGMLDYLPGALSKSGVLGFVQLLKASVYQTNGVMSHACLHLFFPQEAGLIASLSCRRRSFAVFRALSLQSKVLFQ